MQDCIGRELPDVHGAASFEKWVLIHLHGIFLPWNYPRSWGAGAEHLLERAIASGFVDVQ